MIGAILTTAVFALLASTIATIGNFAISRYFSDYGPNPTADVLLLSPDVIRFMQYRLVANIFYHQALALWTLFGALLACELLSHL